MANPKIWSRFERTLHDGSIKKFKIQEVSVELYEDVCQFMTINFLPEEPFSLATDVLNEPRDLLQLHKFWLQFVLPQNCSIVCLEDNEDLEYNKKQLVGVNFLTRCTKIPLDPGDAAKPAAFLKILNEVNSRYNTFETFGIQEYLGAAGLAVSKKYRGWNISKEILLARTPLCKDRGIKVTQAIFTTPGAQVVAKRSGFIPLVEIRFSDVEQKLNGIRFPKVFEKMVVMAKTIE